jgi:hypothetical protein
MRRLPQPHTATGAASAETAAGWTVPGQLTSIPGVSVTNGAANTVPTYALLDGSAAKTTFSTSSA